MTYDFAKGTTNRSSKNFANGMRKMSDKENYANLGRRRAHMCSPEANLGKAATVKILLHNSYEARQEWKRRLKRP